MIQKCLLAAVDDEPRARVCVRPGCGRKLYSDRPPDEIFAQCRASEAPSRGLGDTIAKITKAVGIEPCGGCQERQEALNRLFPYGD